MRLTHALAASLAAAALIAGCGSSPSGSSPAPGGPVARVGKQTIPRSLFDLRVASVLTAAEQSGGPRQGDSGYNAMLDQLRASVLKSLIIDSVIAQEAQFRHVAASDADVQAEVKADSDAAGGSSALQTQLAEAGGSLDQLRDEIRSRINEQRLEDLFARQRAGAILQQLGSGGDFGALARQLSDDDGSRDKGGDMGVMSGAQLDSGDKTFAVAVRALHPGQVVSTPVRDQAGYEIIRLDSSSAAGYAVHRILVAAPRTYTVKERPNWFLQSILGAIGQYCSQGQLTVLIASAEQPCVSAPAQPSPTPTATP
jgi:foldase protein PrsA